MSPFLPGTSHRCHSHYERQLQLKRRAGMQLAPKPEQLLRYPAPQAQGMMQPHVAADAQRDEQRLRVMAVTVMDQQPPFGPARAAPEPVTSKNRLAQTAEPAQGMITAVIAEATAAETP
jgi:hypothetical protein